jgi:hypothetical protein
MQDPPRPCPTLGCDGTKHIATMSGRAGAFQAHHADHAEGTGWTVDVELFDGQDQQWSVYIDVSDEYALQPADFLAMTNAYKTASAYAAVLNRQPAVIR